MFSVSPEIYSVLSQASRWLFILLALMLLFLAFSWHHTDRKERRDRFKNLPGAGTVGELVVLSGSDELPVDTWFPVPREGVLGSLRSCDLVIPCPGVSSHHLDFSWQDGVGLLLRPRSGCEAWVNSVSVDCRSDPRNAPLTHGSCLSVGNAVLRLMIFAALTPASQVLQDSPADPSPMAAAGMPSPDPGNIPGSWIPVPAAPPVQPRPSPAPSVYSAPGSVPVAPAPFPVPETPPEAVPAPGSRPRRSDRWKEDWGE